MKEKLDVYGIGNAIVDLQLGVEESDLRALELTKGGMMLVDTAGQEKLFEYFRSATLSRSSGGSAANTMIAIAQLGGRAAYGCLVGADDFGQHYLNEMSELNVKLHTSPVPNTVTGTSVILITPDAERTMNTHLGASAGFRAKDVCEEHLSQSRWLYIEGYLFSSENGQEAVAQAVQLAKKHGVKIAITFSDGFIIDVFGEQLRNATAQADLIFANANEAKKFARTEDEEQAFLKLKEEIGNVVMTLSERGARIFWQGQEHKVSAVPTKAIDDTGAGDMFAGAFLYGITQGMSAEVSGRLACFLASKVVSQLGPRLRCDVRELSKNFLT